MALRTALMRVLSADLDTMRPPQIDSIQLVSADYVLAATDQVYQRSKTCGSMETTVAPERISRLSGREQNFQKYKAISRLTIA